ncbi:hypothetical protein D9M68_774550 [compost metagenome]
MPRQSLQQAAHGAQRAGAAPGAAAMHGGQVRASVLQVHPHALQLPLLESQRRPQLRQALSSRRQFVTAI